ncbi:MAG: hypothetical protein ACI97N_000394 [Cognaticolwellia sp.]|jgi:hypothetical protein
MGLLNYREIEATSENKIRVSFKTRYGLKITPKSTPHSPIHQKHSQA